MESPKTEAREMRAEMPKRQTLKLKKRGK